MKNRFKVRPDVATDSARAKKAPAATGPSHANRSLARAVQAKLTVGPVGDPLEREADSVAKDVMSGLGNAEPASPQRQEEEELMQGSFEAQRQEDEELLQGSFEAQRQEDEEELQMAPQIGAEGGALTNDLESQVQSARGGGSPLDATLRRDMEGSFGADFSGVRVHTDQAADGLSQSIQAKAFTTGSDVFFRKGNYDPGSDAGRELIAHELTHVVQQGAAHSVNRRISRR